MGWAMASGVRGAVRKTAVAVAFVGLTATGATIPAKATPGFAPASGTHAVDDPDPGLPTGPDDARCATMSWAAECQGGPYAAAAAPAAPALPTSPFDPVCATMPADAACAGGPYAPAAPSAAAPIEAAEPPRDTFGGGVPDEDIGGGIPDEHIGGGIPDMHIGGGMPDMHIGGGMPGHI